MIKSGNFRDSLVHKHLKVTPQRIGILEAVECLKNHPTAEEIIHSTKKNLPNIAIGSIYKSLETFVEKGMIRRFKSDRDIIRYDAIPENHYHIYCAESDRIEDYFNYELSVLLSDYFKNKKIPDFIVGDIQLQIIG